MRGLVDWLDIMLKFGLLLVGFLTRPKSFIEVFGILGNQINEEVLKW